MKRGSILFLALLLAIFSASTLRVQAVPAYPQPITVTQSDGTQLTIQIFGDEFSHHTLTSEGYTVVGGPNGDYYYAQLNNRGELVATNIMARPTSRLTAVERTQLMRMGKAIQPSAPSKLRMAPPTPAPGNSTIQLANVNGITPPGRISSAKTIGKLKSLVILVETSETRFTVDNPQAAFTDLLNKDGYNANSAEGSAWNYYYENSNGKFDPEFVVVGPYKASKTMAYYAGSSGTANPAELIVEACVLANAAGINFSQYADNGVIRDVFVFFAGHNMAEGASKAIWPHRWDVRAGGFTKYLNGALLAGYACSSEYKGASGRRMASIGTFCHEFGHVLGWPDFYNTSSSGSSPGLENYSLMCAGSYNNGSCTPPAINILERWMVGWATPVELDKRGAYALEPITSDKGYLIRTGTNNDYFLFEYRGAKKTVWDNPAYIGDVQGMMAYHIDYTDPDRWLRSNSVNTNPNHECARLIRSVPGAVDEPGKTIFPGSSNITSLSPQNNAHYKAWGGTDPYIFLSSISLMTNTAISFSTSAGVLPDWKFNATTFQRDAMLSWQDAEATSWKISWKKQGTSTILGSQTVTKSEIHIGELTPETAYEIAITPSPENKDNPEQSFIFLTSSLNSERVFIAMSEYEYPANKPILLAANSTETVKSVKWHIDGQPATSTYPILPIGEHKITLVVTYEDASEEYIVKYIQIK